MSQELKLNSAEIAALDHIEAALKSSPAKAQALAAGGGVGDLCEKYQAIKGSLKVLVAILKKIPGFGAKAAAALEFLMGLADTVCPAQ